jgi:hypothetical protein
LEDIKNAKGNTEANSLKQAERINSTGIFDFGVIEGRNKKDEMVSILFKSQT